MTILPKARLGFPFGSARAVTIDVFLDLTCPFCKKAYTTLYKDIQPMIKEQVGLNLFPYPQPWHFQSNLLAKAMIAVGHTNREKVPEFLHHFYEDGFPEFSEAKVKDLTYVQVVEALKPYVEKAGVSFNEFSEKMTIGHDAAAPITQDYKFYAKYGRQNGIHMVPAFVVNGLLDPALDSKLTVEDVQKALASMK